MAIIGNPCHTNCSSCVVAIIATPAIITMVPIIWDPVIVSAKKNQAENRFTAMIKLINGYANVNGNFRNTIVQVIADKPRVNISVTNQKLNSKPANPFPTLVNPTILPQIEAKELSKIEANK